MWVGKSGGCSRHPSGSAPLPPGPVTLLRHGSAQHPIPPSGQQPACPASIPDAFTASRQPRASIPMLKQSPPTPDSQPPTPTPSPHSGHVFLTGSLLSSLYLCGGVLSTSPAWLEQKDFFHRWPEPALMRSPFLLAMWWSTGMRSGTLEGQIRLHPPPASRLVLSQPRPLNHPVSAGRHCLGGRKLRLREVEACLGQRRCEEKNTGCQGKRELDKQNLYRNGPVDAGLDSLTSSADRWVSLQFTLIWDP